MSNYRQCRAYLLNAFLSLDNGTPEEERLRDAIEHVLDAVTRAERDAPLSSPIDMLPPTDLRKVVRTSALKNTAPQGKVAAEITKTCPTTF